MSRKDKIWGIQVQLYTSAVKNSLVFDDDMWEDIVADSARIGLNTIILEVDNCIQYPSHPEISLPDAWDSARVHAEVERCRKVGIALIPQMNFSASHDQWLGDYARMVSSKPYYALLKDLIQDAYELFEHPEYIHIGMDEEDYNHQSRRDFICFRQGKLYWHDLRYLIDCVSDTGARPWIWACPLFDHPEEFKTYIGAGKAILSPWYYNAFRQEHLTPVESRAEYVTYYNEGRYKEMGIRWVEQDPFLVNFRNVALPLLKDGYEYVPCASVFNRCIYNHADLMEYFKINAPDEQILGYISAPWISTTKTERNLQYYEETFRFMKEAMDEFYPE